MENKKGLFEKQDEYLDSGIQCGCLYELNIEGIKRLPGEKYKWNVSHRHVTDFYEDFRYFDKPENSIYLKNNGNSFPILGICLNVKTRLTENFEPFTPENVFDIQFPFDENCPAEIDFQDLSRAETPEQTWEENYPDMLPAAITDENHLFLSTDTLDNHSACTGKGYLRTNLLLKLPYPEEFLGILMIYDTNTHTFIYIAPDPGGTAYWYDSEYQVIVYPTGIPSCPFLTVAIRIIYSYLTEL